MLRKQVIPLSGYKKQIMLDFGYIAAEFKVNLALEPTLSFYTRF